LLQVLEKPVYVNLLFLMLRALRTCCPVTRARHKFLDSSFFSNPTRKKRTVKTRHIHDGILTISSSTLWNSSTPN